MTHPLGHSHSPSGGSVLGAVFDGVVLDLERTGKNQRERARSTRGGERSRLQAEQIAHKNAGSKLASSRGRPPFIKRALSGWEKKSGD